MFSRGGGLLCYRLVSSSADVRSPDDVIAFGRPDWFSAYRYFDQDPLTFQDGRLELVWRNGESPVGLTCRPGGRPTDRGSPVVIDSYAWVYTWNEKKG